MLVGRISMCILLCSAQKAGTVAGMGFTWTTVDDL